jgi:hypothetical protein
VTKACLLIAVVDDKEPVRKALMRSAGLNAETSIPNRQNFPLAVATTPARITTTTSWIAMGMAAPGIKK